ncbi:hypothetical protein SEA_DARWIN_28 [Corynebacterium phage Darwin]|uniref:Minor tail protein n=1 Tax=Corynebacterium phage Darwin TaxID=2047869 RepID=A0A2H4P8J4_9CAUD|nr:tail protein [Corynebacterium phage Darwin]ATW58554.1 hypothetical protein SEA_DARWIN_28 [Corynebacterium phage Darwin]
MLSNPPSTGDVELDNFLRSVKTHINDALRPADGWRLSDLSADVSEVISDKRDLIDIVTAYNDINILKDSVDLALEDFKATANQYQDHAEVFSHTTEWWDQNRKIIEDASQAMAATILASGYADAAAADRVQTGADREATEAAAARAEQSETNAEESATTASTAAAEATDAMEIASEAALSADDGASRAAESADSASQSQAEAATHAQNASAAADRIGTAEQVGEWVQQAASSASSASASESAAEEAATRAEQHEAGAEAALSTKADVVHTHSIEQVNGLQTALDGKASLVGGLIPTSQLPAVALTKPQVVSNRAGMLALTAQEGDVAVITAGADKGTYMLGPGASTNFASWVALATPTDAVTSVNGQTGVVNLSASNVGAAPSSHTHTSAQISDAGSTATASTVVKRDSSGRAQIADPAAAQDAATKAYVDNLVGTRIASIPTPNIVYGTDTSGNQATYTVKGGAFEWSLAQRGANGTLKVGEPSVDTDAATKKYVDTGLSGKAAASHTHTSAQISDAYGYPGESAAIDRIVKCGTSGWFALRNDPTSPDHPARKAYVDKSIINAPKLHTWNGSGLWVAPANAGPNDLVLNTSTKQIFSVQVV